jgi:mono/diheme cytochrome c family protein
MLKKKILFTALLLSCGLLLVAAFNRPYRWWPINEMSEQAIIKPFQNNAFLPPAEGAVAVEDWEAAPDRMQFLSDDGGVVNPFAGDGNAVAAGEKLFATYCQACHGREMSDAPGNKSPVQEKGMPGPGLAIARVRNDAYLFSTISNGSAIMQRYSYHLTPDQRWQIVSYIRHLETKEQ